MASDEQDLDSPLTADDVSAAYDDYQRAKARYLEIVAQYVSAHPDEPSSAFNAFSEDTGLLRVLHAISVGYGWSDILYEVCARAEVAQAQLRGLIARDELHGGLALTRQGTEILQQWIEYVVPLTEKHERYRELWRVVTNLEG